MAPIAVLLMDHDPNYLRLATRFLQHRDDVIVFSSPPTLTQQVPRQPLVMPDLVFFSLGVNIEAGLQMIGQIRTCWPQAYLIVLARGEHKEHRQTALLVGANDFILRPQTQVDALPMIWRRISYHRVQKLS